MNAFLTKLAAGCAVAASLAAAAPASAQGYYGRGWSPGAAAAVGVLGGLAVGGAIAASSRPVYGPPPGYAPAYGPPPGEECYVAHRRVWVPGWGWDVRPVTICD
jgi:hypothetical protein